MTAESPRRFIESLPVPASIVTLLPALSIVSLSAPPLIEMSAPLFVIESFPLRASIVVPSTLLLSVSPAAVPRRRLLHVPSMLSSSISFASLRVIEPLPILIIISLLLTTVE